MDSKEVAVGEGSRADSKVDRKADMASTVDRTLLLDFFVLPGSR